MTDPSEDQDVDVDVDVDVELGDVEIDVDVDLGADDDDADDTPEEASGLPEMPKIDNPPAVFEEHDPFETVVPDDGPPVAAAVPAPEPPPSEEPPSPSESAPPPPEEGEAAAEAPSPFDPPAGTEPPDDAGPGGEEGENEDAPAAAAPVAAPAPPAAPVAAAMAAPSPPTAPSVGAPLPPETAAPLPPPAAPLALAETAPPVPDPAPVSPPAGAPLPPPEEPADAETLAQDTTPADPGPLEGPDDDDDFDLDLDQAPVLPAMGEPEPTGFGATPSVQKPTTPSLDVDSFLSEIMEPSGGETNPGPPPAVGAPPGARSGSAVDDWELDEDDEDEDELSDNQMIFSADTSVAQPDAALLAETKAKDEPSSGETLDEDALLSGEQSAVFAPADPEAPPLIMSGQEPPAISSIDPSLLTPDATTLATLRKLAGGEVDPDRARSALHAALTGAPFSRNELPDSRSMLLGICRVLVSNGQSVDELVDAIVGALEE